MRNFLIYKNSDIELVIHDYTIDEKLTIEDSITSWKLAVSSNKMKGIVELDIIDYIYNSRIYNELLTIKPSTLNLDSFKDGLYKFEMYINNNIVKTNYIILYTNINNKFKELLTKYNYTFTVSDYGYINYIDDSSEYKTEEIRILANLISELIHLKFYRYTSEIQFKIDDIIDKAERIAEIINQ